MSRIGGNPDWVKGVSRNPAGRPKGSKHKMTQIREDWLSAYKEGGGKKLFAELIKKDLSTFFKLGVQMLPKDVNLDVDGKIEVCWIGEDNDPVQTP